MMCGVMVQLALIFGAHHVSRSPFRESLRGQTRALEAAPSLSSKGAVVFVSHSSAFACQSAPSKNPLQTGDGLVVERLAALVEIAVGFELSRDGAPVEPGLLLSPRPLVGFGRRRGLQVRGWLWGRFQVRIAHLIIWLRRRLEPRQRRAQRTRAEAQQ